VELGEVWEELRRRVESRGKGVLVRARVRRSRLDMLRRITRPYLLEATGGEPVRTADGGDGGGDDGRDGAADGDTWLTVELEYPVPAAVRQLLQFGTDVEVLGPPEAVREISRAAAALAALYSGSG
jgi:hypothetical protein